MDEKMVKLLSYLVRLRPRMDTLYVSQSRTVLATDPDGFISDGAEHGLFVHQTRLLSRYRYTVNGEPLQPVALSNVEQHSWLGYYITTPLGVETGEGDQGSGQLDHASQQTLELRLSRTVGAGIHEDVDLTNFTQQPISFQLELEVDADFADQIETKGERKQQGDLKRGWRTAGEGAWELRFDYKVAHEYDHQGNTGTARLHRGVTLRVEETAFPPSYSEGRISFQIDLAPQETWHSCVNIVPIIDGEMMEPMYGCHAFGGVQNEYDKRRAIFLAEATKFTAPQSEVLTTVVVGALEQAKRDLAALRLYDLDLDERAWTLAAGLPMYVALFGRDTLTTAWQAALVSPGMMRSTLPVLARLQGTGHNDWRDEQPGRMLHEAHTGPLEILNFNPRARYYGSITTSGFYPVIVSELWHWTGDKELVRPLVESAMKALKWLDKCSDFNGDGFYEYKTRSEQGTEHQAWKDSADAIVYEDGSQVEAPIATCEEQGFAYLAKLHMSELLWWLDEKIEAKRLYREAGELKKRFNETFWMEDEGFFAMGLDSNGRQIKSIGSNPGHCLAAAVVDDALVERAADRLLSPDMFSGWGIRTLSSVTPITRADKLRPEARASLTALHQNGFRRILMITGDNTGTARAVASQLGVDEFRAEPLPDDKVRIVRELETGGERVAFVGDGVNDAPALATATVGLAMGAAGTDVALETADIALMGDDLSRLPFVVRLSRKTLAIIKQNIWFSIAVKGVFLVLALFGYATLWMAVASDMGALRVRE